MRSSAARSTSSDVLSLSTARLLRGLPGADRLRARPLPLSRGLLLRVCRAAENGERPLRLVERLLLRRRPVREGDDVRAEAEYVERAPERPTKPVMAPRIPPPPPPLAYVHPEAADLPGLLPRDVPERVRVVPVPVPERVREAGDGERVCRVCVWLPLPKLHAETSDLPSLRERLSELAEAEAGPRMLRESAPGIPSVAVLTVGGFVGEPGRKSLAGADVVRVCRPRDVGTGNGRGEDGRWAERSSYRAMSSLAVRFETLPVVLLVVG